MTTEIVRKKIKDCNFNDLKRWNCKENEKLSPFYHEFDILIDLIVNYCGLISNCEDKPKITENLKNQKWKSVKKLIKNEILETEIEINVEK